MWKGDVGKKIFDDVGAATGLKIMGSGLQGVRVVTSTVPVQSVEDVKGLKLRVPTIDVYLKTWQWLGAAANPLPGSEIFTSLQQKTVEGQENPTPTVPTCPCRRSAATSPRPTMCTP